MTTANSEVVTNFETNHEKKEDSSKSSFQAAHKEVYELLIKDTDGSVRKSINDQFKDSNGKNEWLANMELVNFDKADGDLRFKDKNGNFVDVDANGNKKAVLGGDKDGNNGREFTTDEKGNITSYNVKKGDTVWSIAETICNERNKGTNKQPTAQEIQAESKKLVAANPELKDPDKIYDGKTVIKVSVESSQEITKKRNPEAETEKSDKQLTECDSTKQVGSAQAEKEAAVLNKYFDSISSLDGRKDGYEQYITPDEVDAFLKDPKNKNMDPTERATLESAKNHLGRIQGVSNDEWGFENDGATKEDINGFAKREKDFEDKTKPRDFLLQNFDKIMECRENKSDKSPLTEKDVEAYKTKRMSDSSNKPTAEELASIEAAKEFARNRYITSKDDLKNLPIFVDGYKYDYYTDSSTINRSPGVSTTKDPITK